MATQPEHVDVSFYVTVQPEFDTRNSFYSKDDKGRPILKGAKAVSLTQTRPQRDTRAGSVVTRLTLRIDADALLPLHPEAVIHVRAGDVDLIEVEADAPPPAPEEIEA